MCNHKSVTLHFLLFYNNKYKERHKVNDKISSRRLLAHVKDKYMHTSTLDLHMLILQ